jgi:hypothetical protein
MSKSTKILAIVEDSTFLSAIEQWRDKHGLDQLIQAPSAVEGIAFYESYRPDAVILEENISDMPISFLVPALNQLIINIPIWIMTSSGEVLDPDNYPEGAYGTLSPDLHAVLPQSLFQKLPFIRSLPDLGQSDTVGIWQDDSLTDSFFPGQILTAEELVKRDKIHQEGDLHIIGDVLNVEELIVNGNLSIQGNCIDTHIQCDGDLNVEGTISGKTKGVFCSGSLTVHSLDQALVVCRNHLFFQESCQNSIINVMGRMIGTGPDSHIVGGRNRIGQHLAVSRIGDDEQTETMIEMAPPIFHESLMKRYFGEDTPQNESFKALQIGDAPLFTPKRFEDLADISAETVFNGVTLKIGSSEDFTIKDYEGGYHIYLAGEIVFKKKNKQTLTL